MTPARGGRWAIAGYGAHMGAQWLLLVLLVKLGDAAWAGRYALALALVGPLFLLANLSLRGVLTTDARREFAVTTCVHLRLATTTAAVLAVGGAALVVGGDLVEAAEIALVGAAAGCEALSDLAQGLFLQRGRADAYGRSLVLKGAGALLGVALGASQGGALAWGLVGLVGGRALVLALHDAPLAWRLAAGDAPLADRGVGALARVAFPLGVTVLLLALQTSACRFIVEGYVGERALGAFASLSQLALAGGVLVVALGQAASAPLAEAFAAGDVAGFRRGLRGLLLAGTAVGAVTVAVAGLAGQPLVRLVYSEEVAGHADAFLGLSVWAALGFWLGPLGVALTSMRAFRVQLVLNGLAAAATAALCAALVPGRGLAGAVDALIAVAGFQLVAFGWVVVRRARLVVPPSAGAPERADSFPADDGRGAGEDR